MNRILPLAICSLLLLPAVASAAAVTADIRTSGTIELGPVTFTGARGEVNRVTVTNVLGRLRFHDDNNRVRARGDCDQVNRNTAVCPSSEDIAQVRLGNRDDTAKVEGLVTVLGGDGNDLLRGSAGNDILNGERGNDTLHGFGNGDDLTGGPGRDRLFGGSSDDDLFDGETDAQAAPDLYRGGSSRDTRFGRDQGDTIDYSKRKRALDIDLSRGRAKFGGDRDVIRGLESIVGGRAGDRLSGDGDDNWVDGRGGNDRVRGRGGDDNVRGESGNDNVRGDDGNDQVFGGAGRDAMSGGNGDDEVFSRDGQAETVACGAGEDSAPTSRIDTLRDCEVGSSERLQVRVNPEVEGSTATFGVSCISERGCSGTLTLTSLDGEAYGSGDFTDLPHGADLFTPVDVTLTPAGQAALAEGQVVSMTFGSGDGGFRAFMRADG